MATASKKAARPNRGLPLALVAAALLAGAAHAWRLPAFNAGGSKSAGTHVV